MTSLLLMVALTFPPAAVTVKHVDTLPRPGNVFGTSMEPLIKDGDFWAGTPYDGRKLKPGTVAIFVAKKGPHPFVIHMVIRRSGDYYLFQGINTKKDDGWIHKSEIFAVVDHIFTTRKQ